MVIWKFELLITDMQEVTIPAGAELLSVANQNGNLCIWAMVNPSNVNERRYIEIIGTGSPVYVDMGVDRKFIGTVVMDRFVWHIFERL